MSHYYIVDSITNMLCIMSMIVIIIHHGTPMMDVHLMLMILIRTPSHKDG